MEIIGIENRVINWCTQFRWYVYQVSLIPGWVWRVWSLCAVVHFARLEEVRLGTVSISVIAKRVRAWNSYNYDECFFYSPKIFRLTTGLILTLLRSVNCSQRANSPFNVICLWKNLLCWARIAENQCCIIDKSVLRLWGLCVTMPKTTPDKPQW